MIEQTISSVEVAEMVGKDHNMLLRDIRRYVEQFRQSKIAQSDFFTESTYQNSQNKTMPCYQVTKKGCEFIAHKLTGAKGTAFTARYINRFHVLQEQISQESEKKELVALRKQIEKQNRLLTTAMSSRIPVSGYPNTVEGKYKSEVVRLMETIRTEKILRRIYLFTRTVSEQQQIEVLEF